LHNRHWHYEAQRIGASALENGGVVTVQREKVSPAFGRGSDMKKIVSLGCQIKLITPLPKGSDN
jgi:hypothetical protein